MIDFDQLLLKYDHVFLSTGKQLSGQVKIQLGIYKKDHCHEKTIEDKYVSVVYLQ